MSFIITTSSSSPSSWIATAPGSSPCSMPTRLGNHSSCRNGESLPFEIDDMERDAVVVDLVYGRETTPLVSRFRQRGGVSIDGRDVLLAQVARQFQVMTGRTMPAGIGRRLIGRTSDGGSGVMTKSNERSEMTR